MENEVLGCSDRFMPRNESFCISINSLYLGLGRKEVVSSRKKLSCADMDRM